jgi:multidrug resistance efflux pump
MVRAPVTGTVADIRVREGSALNAGDQVLQIVNADAEPEVWAFLPGKDRPRLQPGNDLQVEIVGYTKSREHAKITYVSPEAFGASEAAKAVGPALADSIKLGQGAQYVWVRAKLPGKTYKTQNNLWFYHHGMPVKAEVKLTEKPFIVTLLPSLGKYIPD